MIMHKNLSATQKTPRMHGVVRLRQKTLDGSAHAVWRKYDEVPLLCPDHYDPDLNDGIPACVDGPVNCHEFFVAEGGRDAYE